MHPVLNLESLMEAFVSYSDVHSITAQGSTKSSIVLKNGIAVDLRVVEPSQYPSALLHFTGSKEHNTALRARAKKNDLKLNEYGLFKGEDPLPVNSEEEIYQHLDLCFIPPEAREDRGELELADKAFAERGTYPSLVELRHLKGVLHAHSTYSDGANTLAQLASAVRDMGYEYLGITEHSRSAAYAGGLSVDDIKRQHEEIDQLNESLAPFKIFKGIESDILADGSLDYEDAVLASFDFIIASIHSRLKMDEADMTKRVVAAVENPHTTILGHLTGRLLLRREPLRARHGCGS